MKNIIISLASDVPIQHIQMLEEAYLLQDQRSVDADICKYVRKFFETKGFYPTPEHLRKNFPSYEEGVKVDNTTEYIVRLISEIKERKARSLLLEISSDSVLTPDRLDQVKKLMDRASTEEAVTTTSFDGQTAYRQIKERPAGMKFGVDLLDEEVSGLAYGTILTMFGFVASLKTTTAISMAYYNAKELGYNVAYISLEVPSKELYFNFLSRHAFDMYPDTRITAKRIKKALLTEEEEKQLFEEIEPSFKNIKGKIFVMDRDDISTPGAGELTPESFTAALKQRDRECNGLDAFVLDYVNLCKYFRTQSKYDNPVNAFVGYVNDLVINFSDRGLIAILLAQANRGGWLKASKRGGKYQLDAIAEFNQLEQSSYYIASLFLDDALRASGEARMQLLKHRAGNIIQEPFTTLTVPDNFFVGDRVGYTEAYSVSSLDEVLL